MICSRFEGLKSFDEEPSCFVQPSSRLKNDLFALECLLEDDVPRKSPVRLPMSGWVSYGIGDASGNGYGTAVHIGGEIVLNVRAMVFG